MRVRAPVFAHSYVWGKNVWVAASGSAPAEPIPRAAFSTYVPSAQHARLSLQREALMGWWGT